VKGSAIAAVRALTQHHRMRHFSRPTGARFVN